MIPRIVLVCLLFQLGYGSYLKYIPGQYPGEQELYELLESYKDAPLLADAHIPLWASAVRGLANEEDALKLIFRFFNRPNSHRYILDIILLIGNLNVTDEGLWPYFKREDGRAPLQPIIDEVLASESSTTGSTVETLTDRKGLGVEFYSDNLAYPTVAGQSTERESDNPELVVQVASEEGGEEAFMSVEPGMDSTTEYIIYQSSESEEVPQTTAEGVEQSEYTVESIGHQVTNEDSSKFQHRSGYKYPSDESLQPFSFDELLRLLDERHIYDDDSSEEEELGIRSAPESPNPGSMEPVTDSTTEYTIYESTGDEEVQTTADGIEQVEYTEESMEHQSSEQDSGKFRHRYGYRYPPYKRRIEERLKNPYHEHHKRRDDSYEELSEKESSEEIDRRTGLAPDSETMTLDSEEPGMDSTIGYTIYQFTEEDPQTAADGVEESSEDSAGFQHRYGYKYRHYKPRREWRHKYPHHEHHDRDDSSEESSEEESSEEVDRRFGFLSDLDSIVDTGEEDSRFAVNEKESDSESTERHRSEKFESVERRSGLAGYQIDAILKYANSVQRADDNEGEYQSTESVDRMMADDAMEASQFPAVEMEPEESGLKSTEQHPADESSNFEQRYGHDHPRVSKPRDIHVSVHKPHGVHHVSEPRVHKPHGVHHVSEPRVHKPHGVHVSVQKPHGIHHVSEPHGFHHVSEPHVPKPHGIPDHVSELHYVKPKRKCDHEDHSHHRKCRPTKVPHVGSIRGIPGVHFPDYREIPITSFTCSDKKHIPGFYADLETGCQVFHVCWPHRRESFLCPVGTIFNQPLLACDYWYNGDCSKAPLYYDINKNKHIPKRKIPVVEDPIVPERPRPIVPERPITVVVPERPVIDHFKEKVIPERPITVVVPERPIIDHFKEKVITERPITVVVPKRPVIDHFKEKVILERPITVVVPERPTVVEHLEKKRPLSKPFKKWSEILKFLPVKSKVTAYSESSQKPKHVAPVKELKTEIKAAKKAFASKVISDVLGMAEGLVKNVEPVLAQVASVGHLPVKSMHGAMGKKHFGNPSISRVVLAKPASMKLPGLASQKLDRFGDYDEDDYDYYLEENELQGKYYPPKKYSAKHELRKKNRRKKNQW